MNKKVYYPGERQGAAIRECKRIAAELAKAAETTCILLHEMRECLYELEEVDQTGEIRKLIDRAGELSRLENQQEIQSWRITVDRVMQAAWEDLP